MAVAGVVLLAYGIQPDLCQQARHLFQKIEWEKMLAVIIRTAECSKWFYSIIQATRDLYKKW